MTYGKKVDGGQTLGKSIIFAYNHLHAQMIVEVFREMYPQYSENYCQLVDNYVNYADDLVLKFGEDPEFRLAVSVDMLDTGVDVPEILNLVFFKPVKSKIKFVQMIGRGTRLCPDIFGYGKDKRDFRIFDYCGNFEYFGEHPEGTDPKQTYSLTQRLFDTKLEMLRILQRAEFQQDTNKKKLYDSIKDELKTEVSAIKLHSTRMNVRREMAYVDKYCQENIWDSISAVMLKEMNSHITPLIDSSMEDDYKTVSFDIKVYEIEKALLKDGTIKHAAAQVKSIKKAAKFLLEEKAAIPKVLAKVKELKELTGDSYWNHATVESLEESRAEVRDLMAYATNPNKPLPIDIEDDSEFSPVPGSAFADFDIRTYREKVIDYLAQHLDNPSIQKIRNMEPITAQEIHDLEDVLWNDLGTKDEYASTARTGNVAVFIRSLVGLSQDAINEKFGEYLGSNRFNSVQQEFLQSIIDYVRENGDILRETLIEDEPFNNYDVGTIFDGDVTPVIEIVDTLHDCIVVS